MTVSTLNGRPTDEMNRKVRKSLQVGLPASASIGALVGYGVKTWLFPGAPDEIIGAATDIGVNILFPGMGALFGLIGNGIASFIAYRTHPDVQEGVKPGSI